MISRVSRRRGAKRFKAAIASVRAMRTAKRQWQACHAYAVKAAARQARVGAATAATQAAAFWY
jgi:hypothetical protein